MKHQQLTAELQEKAILYAAGALDENERREFARHLEDDNCEVCRAEVLESEAAAQSLLMNLPLQTPSESVKKRLLAQAEVSSATPPRREGRKSFFPILGWLAAAASLVLLVVAYSSNTALRSQVAALNSRVVQLENEMGGQKMFLASLISSRPFNLTGPASNAHVRVFWDEPARQWHVFVTGLPQAASNRTYQLWFLPKKGNPVSAAVFNTNANGSAQVELALPATLPELKAAAITEEPAPGSPQPTTTPFLVGNTE